MNTFFCDSVRDINILPDNNDQCQHCQAENIIKPTFKVYQTKNFKPTDTSILHHYFISFFPYSLIYFILEHHSNVVLSYFACFYFCLLLYFAIEALPVNNLFRRELPTIPIVMERPPTTESIPFKIPIRIIECVMNNRYAGDETVHPGSHLLNIKGLCELFNLSCI